MNFPFKFKEMVDAWWRKNSLDFLASLDFGGDAEQLNTFFSSELASQALLGLKHSGGSVAPRRPPRPMLGGGRLFGRNPQMTKRAWWDPNEAEPNWDVPFPFDALPFCPECGGQPLYGLRYVEYDYHVLTHCGITVFGATHQIARSNWIQSCIEMLQQQRNSATAP